MWVVFVVVAYIAAKLILKVYLYQVYMLRPRKHIRVLIRKVPLSCIKGYLPYPPSCHCHNSSQEHKYPEEYRTVMAKSYDEFKEVRKVILDELHDMELYLSSIEDKYKNLLGE